MVQAPHWLVSQPTWVPVRPASSRMKWTSSKRGSTSCEWLVPLMVTVTFCFTTLPPGGDEGSGAGKSASNLMPRPPGCQGPQPLADVRERSAEQPAAFLARPLERLTHRKALVARDAADFFELGGHRDRPTIEPGHLEADGAQGGGERDDLAR